MAKVFRRRWTGPDGKRRESAWWFLDYRIDGQRVIRRTFPQTTSKRVALEQLHAALAAGARRREQGPSVKDVLAAYGEHLKAHSLTTWRVRRYWLDWWRDELGDRAAADLEPADVDRLVTRLASRVKPGTVGGYLRTLRSAFRRALPDHPVGHGPVGFRSPKRTVTWTDDDLVKLLGKLPPWAVPLVRWLRLTGMRVGDALALRWEDVGEAHVEWRQQKGRRQTAIPLSPPAVALLEKIRPEPARGLVFPGRDGQQRLYSNVLRAFAAARVESGTAGTIHDLRRTFATELHNRGVSDELIAALLGQKTTGVVPMYRETRFEALRRALG